MISRLIEVIEDRHTLSDCLFFIMQALETKKMPDMLPTLNDEMDEANLRVILEKICGEDAQAIASPTALRDAGVIASDNAARRIGVGEPRRPIELPVGGVREIKRME